MPTENIPLCEGDQFITLTGRITAPFPRANYKSERRNEKALRQWLKSEAIAEAEHRHDAFNRTSWSALDINNWSPADGYSVNLYLFDDMEGRIGSRKAIPSAAAPA